MTYAMTYAMTIASAPQAMSRLSGPTKSTADHTR
jgi:hypothetical protein